MGRIVEASPTIASPNALHTQGNGNPRVGQGILQGDAHGPRRSGGEIGLTPGRLCLYPGKQNRQSNSPSSIAHRRCQIRAGDLVASETDMRRKRTAAGRERGRVLRMTHDETRQTKPISRVLGPETRVGEENKANWRPGKQGQVQPATQNVPVPVFLSPLSDSGLACKQICKAKPISPTDKSAVTCFSTVIYVGFTLRPTLGGKANQSQLAGVDGRRGRQIPCRQVGMGMQGWTEAPRRAKQSQCRVPQTDAKSRTTKLLQATGFGVENVKQTQSPGTLLGYSGEPGRRLPGGQQSCIFGAKVVIRRDWTADRRRKTSETSNRRKEDHGQAVRR